MGMASSQARLLSLTSRQLDVELRAQVLQARKLQLESDSKHVYNNYMEALNESSIKYRFTNNLGESVTRDATLNGLQNGLVGAYGASDKVMFMSSIDGNTLYVTPTVNNKYDLSGISEGKYANMNAYLEKILGPQAFESVQSAVNTSSSIKPLEEVIKILNTDSKAGGETANFYSAYRSPQNLIEFIDWSGQSAGGVKPMILIRNVDDFTAYLNTFSENIQRLIDTDNSESDAAFSHVDDFLNMDIYFMDSSIFASNDEDFLVALQNAANANEILKTQTGGLDLEQYWDYNLYLLNNNTQSDSSWYGGYYYITNNEDTASSLKGKPVNTVTTLEENSEIWSNLKKIFASSDSDNIQIQKASLMYEHVMRSGLNSYADEYASNMTNVTGFVSGAQLYEISKGEYNIVTAGNNVGDTASNIYNALTMFKTDYENTYNVPNIPTLDEIKKYLAYEDDNGNLYPMINYSNILYNLNKSCELYLAYRSGNLEECLDKYNSLTLAPEFAENTTAEKAKAKELDILGNRTKITDAEFSEQLDSSSNYFMNLINEINKFTQYGGEGLVQQYPPVKTSTVDDPVWDDARRREFLADWKTSDYDDEKGTYAYKLLNDEIPLGLFVQDSIEYTTIEDDNVVRPSDYALANNIYMAISEYTINNDEKENVAYGDSATFKKIYDKVAGLTDEQCYQAQKIIQDYLDWQKKEVYFVGGVESLQNYFLGDSTDKSFLSNSEVAGKTFSTRDEGITTATAYSDTEAEKYFEHYSDFMTVESTRTIDTSKPDVQKAIAMYKLGSSYSNIEVTSESLASDAEYVNNMVKNAAGVLLTVDTSKVAATEYEYLTYSSNWDDDGEEKHLKEVSNKMGANVAIEDVDVATSIYLEEVFDSAKANQAQAIYESEMAKINVKETRIDTELTELEAERQAIKTAQDSTKQVAKDNVSLTFKLFS